MMFERPQKSKKYKLIDEIIKLEVRILEKTPCSFASYQTFHTPSWYGDKGEFYACVSIPLSLRLDTWCSQQTYNREMVISFLKSKHLDEYFEVYIKQRSGEGYTLNLSFKRDFEDKVPEILTYAKLIGLYE